MLAKKIITSVILQRKRTEIVYRMRAFVFIKFDIANKNAPLRIRFKNPHL